jgi:hypothetical protein
MKKFLRWAVWFPAGVLLALFLIANRKPVALSLDPVSTTAPAFATPALPLWFWLVLFLLAGFGLGAAGMWMAGGDFRRRAKADRLELKALKRAAGASETTPSQTPPSGAS